MTRKASSSPIRILASEPSLTRCRGRAAAFIVTNKRLLPARMIAERLGMMSRLAGVYALDSSRRRRRRSAT